LRKIILYVAISLDGYITRLEDKVDWLFNDAEWRTAYFRKSIDTIILGRKLINRPSILVCTITGVKKLLL
jgi:hypothetical protein